MNTTAFSIPASPGQPAQTATLTQTLPAGATGVVTLDVSSTLSDGVSQTDSGTFDLSTINCAAPEQTIAGHIYLCNNGNPTTTEETGGTLAASGTALTTVPSALNPLAPANVISGTYSVTASNPPGFQLVACGGSSSPNGAGTSATESVSVPSGGAGVGVFYVSPSSPPVPVTPSATVNSNPPTTTSDSSNQPSTPINLLPPSTGTNWNKASIALKKSASIRSFSAPGTLVTYSYTVTNTGNVTLDP